jgi:hypothetical protein
VKAGEVDETEEVFDVVFLSSDESPEVVHPCEEPLHFPASAVAAQQSFLSPYLSTALRRPNASLWSRFWLEAPSTNSPPGLSAINPTTQTRLMARFRTSTASR